MSHGSYRDAFQFGYRDQFQLSLRDAFPSQQGEWWGSSPDFLCEAQYARNALHNQALNLMFEPGAARYRPSHDLAAQMVGGVGHILGELSLLFANDRHRIRCAYGYPPRQYGNTFAVDRYLGRPDTGSQLYRRSDSPNELRRRESEDNRLHYPRLRPTFADSRRLAAESNAWSRWPGRDKQQQDFRAPHWNPPRRSERQHSEVQRNWTPSDRDGASRSNRNWNYDRHSSPSSREGHFHSRTASKLSNIAEQVSQEMRTVGWCATGVRKALQRIGINLPGFDAKDAPRVLMASGKFDLIPVRQLGDLKDGDVLFRPASPWRRDRLAKYGDVAIAKRDQQGFMGYKDHANRIRFDDPRYDNSKAVVLRLKSTYA